MTNEREDEKCEPDRRLARDFDRLEREFIEHVNEFVKLTTRFDSFVVATNKELEHLNQLRQEVVTDRGLFLTKDIYLEQHRQLTESVDKLNLWRVEATGVQGQHSSTLQERDTQLHKTEDRLEVIEKWKANQTGASTVWIIGAGVIGTIIGAIVIALVVHLMGIDAAQAIPR